MYNIICSALVDWSRAQFALTAMYHWLFVPLTLGLSFIIAIMETNYFITKDDKWREITKFWMKLFAINFAIGVATGIILEFQFGTNWSNYSWIVGDIFGAPLAIEGIMAFFLESTFVVIMLFGWKKVSRSFHLLSTWLVFIGANLSAYWILVANAWMQYPTGMYFNPDTARNEMIDFAAVAFNAFAINKFLHTIGSGFIVGALFVAGISAWFILKNKNITLAKKSIKIAALFGLFASLFVAFTGDGSAYQVAQKQPMKLAALEGLYKGKTNAGLVVLGMTNPAKKPGNNEKEYIFSLEAPQLLSLLAKRNAGSFVPGIEDLLYGNDKEGIRANAEKIAKGKEAIAALAVYKQAKKEGNRVVMQEALYNFEDNYHYMGYGYFDKPEETVPAVGLLFYSFRIMVGLGFFFIFLFILLIIYSFKDKLINKRWLLLAALWSIPLGYLSSQLGWIVAEMGRQPFAIQDLLPVKVATSAINSGSVITTFFIFALLFTILLIVEIKIMLKQIKTFKIN
ncbi:MAG: cytochrome ubiquinol oxidase subunit I [Bacteroidales bacterium]|nr:cytochrome ubiquinol oxidase subunit I [Bacteroidales bacterium]